MLLCTDVVRKIMQGDGHVVFGYVVDGRMVHLCHDGKGAFGLSGQPADTTPPLVTITSPTRMDSYETDQNSLKIIGEAQDSNQVSKVTWKSSNGGAGTADPAPGRESAAWTTCSSTRRRSVA